MPYSFSTGMPLAYGCSICVKAGIIPIVNSLKIRNENITFEIEHMKFFYNFKNDLNVKLNVYEIRIAYTSSVGLA